jgi:hypothetical protein
LAGNVPSARVLRERGEFLLGYRALLLCSDARRITGVMMVLRPTSIIRLRSVSDSDRRPYDGPLGGTDEGLLGFRFGLGPRALSRIDFLLLPFLPVALVDSCKLGAKFTQCVINERMLVFVFEQIDSTARITGCEEPSGGNHRL